MGNDAGIFTNAKNSIDLREHAGPQLQCPVVDAAANAYRPPVRVNQRINCLDLHRVALAGQRIDVEHGGLAAPDLALVALGQPEIHIDGVNALDIDNAGFAVLASLLLGCCYHHAALEAAAMPSTATAV